MTDADGIYSLAPYKKAMLYNMYALSRGVGENWYTYRKKSIELVFPV